MASQSNPRPIIDHIVILVPYDTLFELPERLKDSFTIIHGGEHAGGQTINKLIILPDGSYIELIAFNKGLTPDQRRSHRWGSLEEGRIIDWAYTLPDESDFAQVQQRVQQSGANIVYQDPVAGGRTRPDGVVLKWAVAGAQDSEGNPAWPGNAPFWCLDRTPRHLRVPYRDENGLLGHTSHPSKAHGVSKVTVLVSGKDVPKWKQVYEAIHKTSPGAESTEGEWKFDVYSGSTNGNHRVLLSALEKQDTKSEIRLALLGTEQSPKSVELLPGLIVDFDAA
ncbi:glyoxalase-like domain-containing protein [Thelonectria olida]|uniref:Glyoxalase-like domain-containing protein n=1 Tax=Thelonectria olida TaxID=1576542 RepID=A0A9P9AVZ3_9HYPO|nr:glyoxalase-like domain-containing protein [Thelonectria olida]